MARVNKSSAQFPHGYSEYGGKKHRLTKAGNVDLRTVSPAQRANYKRMKTKFNDAKQLLKSAVNTLGENTDISYDKIKNERLNYDDLHQYVMELTDDLNSLESELEESLYEMQSMDEDERDYVAEMQLESKLEEISTAVSKMKTLSR